MRKQYEEFSEESGTITRLNNAVLLLAGTCTEPSILHGKTNSTVYNGVYFESNTVFFSCDYGYKLNGTNSSTCQSDGTWEPQPATCILGSYFKYS